LRVVAGTDKQRRRGLVAELDCDGDALVGTLPAQLLS
jgi:hypothetical protein